MGFPKGAETSFEVHNRLLAPLLSSSARNHKGLETRSPLGHHLGGGRLAAHPARLLLHRTFEMDSVNQSAGQEILENSNYILILF